MKRAAFLLAPAILAWPLVTLGADNPVSDIESLARQWTDLEQQKDVLRANWRRDKPSMEQQLELLQRERSELTTMLEETREERGEVEERREELLQMQTQFEQEQAMVNQELGRAIINVQGVHTQLPPPLADTWDDLMPRLLNDENADSERLQVLVEMLTDLDDFQRTISLNKTVMEMDNGESYQVTQVYLGLAQGWYVSADGQFAGQGYPTPQGWQWDTVSESQAITDMVAVLERRSNAVMVSLPVTLGGGQ